ncbi:MAG TPA: GNAT family N-acetyltransferase [Polyangiaceae bacterium]|jgi:amino-acid N-acetyltransferase
MNTPPQRVRVARLQDTQLDGVVAVDAACKQQLHRAGVPATEEPVRGLAGVAKLTRLHNVLVADADGVVAGYAAWRDESPGVAYLEELAVKPELQRHGIAEKLLDAVRGEARAVSLPVLLTRMWSKNAAGKALLEKAGFTPLASHASERVTQWKEEQEAAEGHGVAKDGQVVMAQSLL